MLLAGFSKLTLIDYPNKIASVCFTQGCNFNCPFCHNPEQIKIFNPDKNCPLVDSFKRKTLQFLDFLKTRQGKLEGVCITGGEPTLQTDLVDFIKQIKDLGFLVKLDSQGSNPEVLKNLFQQKLLDYVAMDIKHTEEKYPLAMGRKVEISKIKNSIELIKNSGIDYEFRTTTVPGIHTENDFNGIAKLIQNQKNSKIPKPKFFIQEFRNVSVNDKNIIETAKNHKIDLNKVKEIMQKYGLEVGIRWNN
jgi:pyruvate formate lyase activating enzyme